MLLARQPRGQQRGTLVGLTGPSGSDRSLGSKRAERRSFVIALAGHFGLTILGNLPGPLAFSRRSIALEDAFSVFVDPNPLGGLRIWHHKIALLIQYMKAARRLARRANTREVGMNDVVRRKPEGPERRRREARPRSGGIRVLQPEEEMPLQTRCRCSGPSYSEQPKGAGFDPT